MRTLLNKITSILLVCTLLTLNACSFTFAYELKPKPGLATIKNLLSTALLPVGTTMYIWGGGWNTDDTGSGKGSTHIGLMGSWRYFFYRQNSTYNFKDYLYQINNGLDCSGFIGWTLYNVFNIEDDREGFVMPSSKMASEFAKRGFGTYKDKGKIVDYKPGDIMSGPGHVYICIGQCTDDSLLFIHSSPPGVQINGTVTPDGVENSMAVQLATHYMNKYYPEWSERFPNFIRGKDYLTKFSQMRWSIDNTGVMVDPDNYFDKDITEILKDLFNENN